MKEGSLDIYKSLARLFLPDEVLDYFDVVNFEEIHTGKTFFGDYPEKELHLYLDEKDMFHPGNDGYRPNGFTEEKVMHDFPIRDRKAILHIRRRRWINAEGHNEVLDYGDLLGVEGTKFSREFAAFLKECP